MSIAKKILILILFQGLVCQKWEFPKEINGLIGSCVEIPCTFRPRERSATSSTVWYLYQRRGYPQIFNSQSNSSVLTDYRDRASQVPGNNSCSLMIDHVRREDDEKYFYPGIAEDESNNAYSQSSMSLLLHVTDNPTIPKITGIGEMLEGRRVTFECYVEHTCGSNPPSLKWNKPGQTKRQSKDISGGKWREILRLTYMPSYEDDKTEIKCTATYHNGETSSHNAKTLSIRYAPKDVTVSLPENREFIEGSEVNLTCSSNSNPPPERYEWYRANRKMKIGLEKRITVQNVRKDTEPYSCVAINDVGRGESPPTQIPVQYAATGVQVTVFPTEGAGELKCSFVSSHPNVTHYTWMKDGNTLLNKTEQILVLDSNELNSGQYSCIAHNTAGSSTSEELNFKDTPHISKLTENGEMLEGRREIFACSVVHTRVSNPPSLKWNKIGQTENRTEDLSGGKRREILTITYIPSHEDDKTQMQCTATYHNGETSHKAATLDIRYAATGVQVIVLPTEGATELKCSFVSSHPNVTHYSWMKDGNILLNKTEQILVLDGSENKFGSYSCIAHNTAGNSTSAELEFKDISFIDSKAILFPILGILAGVILLILIVYIVKRKKACQKSTSHENSQPLDHTYMNLQKNETSSPEAGGNLYENLHLK